MATAVDDPIPGQRPVRLGYTIVQLARAIGLHPDTIRDNIKAGNIQASKVGLKWIVPTNEIRRLFPGMGI